MTITTTKEPEILMLFGEYTATLPNINRVKNSTSK